MTTVGIKEDNHQSADITQSDIKSHESRTKEWLITIKNSAYDTSKKTGIDMVPTLLRENESFGNCFDPLIVSVGPYHFENSRLPRLKEFQQLKFIFARIFCDTYGVHIEQLYDEVAKVGDSARKFYAKGLTERYNDEEFNRIMFLDALFVLYVVFRPENHSSKADEDHAVNERLVKNYELVLRDLILLENQIPLLVIKVLMKLMSKEQEREIDDFITSVVQSFTIKPRQRNLCTNNIAMKFLGKMTGCCSKSAPKMESPDWDESKDHLLQLVRKKLISPIVTSEIIDMIAYIKKSSVRESYRSVTDLKSAGIYFKPNQTGNLADVEFKPRLVSGIITLPSVRFDNLLARPLLLNLLAYEISPHGPPDLLITSYICLMDSLIDHADDVKELRRQRIITNKLGSDEELAQFLNKIASHLVPNPFTYHAVKLKIDKHCEQIGHSWMAESKHKYFSSPWALLALVGAILVLLLTMAQTYFAAYPR